MQCCQGFEVKNYDFTLGHFVERSEIPLAGPMKTSDSRKAQASLVVFHDFK